MRLKRGEIGERIRLITRFVLQPCHDVGIVQGNKGEGVGIRPASQEKPPGFDVHDRRAIISFSCRQLPSVSGDAEGR